MFNVSRVSRYQSCIAPSSNCAASTIQTLAQFRPRRSFQNARTLAQDGAATALLALLKTRLGGSLQLAAPLCSALKYIAVNDDICKVADVQLTLLPHRVHEKALESNPLDWLSAKEHRVCRISQTTTALSPCWRC